MQNQIEAVREILTLKKEPEAAPIPEDVDVPEELLVDMPEEGVVEEVEAEAVDTEAPAEAVAGEETYSVSSLAEAIGWEAQDLYAVEVPLDNGEKVKLGELKNAHQNTVREFEQTKAKLAEMEGSVGGLAGMGDQVSEEVMQATAAKEALIQRYQSIDWDRLEQDDKAEAALLRQKYQTAYNQAEGQVQAAHQHQEQLRMQGLQLAHKQMLEIVPEWKDDSVRDAEHTQIRGLMKEYGYDDGTINAISDPRALKLFRDFNQLRAEKAKAASSVAKVRAAPKVLKGHKAAAPVKKVDSGELRRNINSLPPGKRRTAELDAVKQLMGVKG